MDLTDEQWHLIEPLLPPQRPLGGRGRPPLDRRLILNGIFWKLRTGEPWRAVPPRYGSHQACYQHYLRWQRSGLLKDITSTLLKDVRERGGFDFEEALKQQHIQLGRVGDKYTVFVPAVHLDSWQVSTAMLFYQHLVKHMQKQHRQRMSLLK